MTAKQRLELTWIGKDKEIKLEPRILIEDATKSYGDKKSENMLVFGDNLLALKSLEQDFANTIQCIYIDPPYNTGNAFPHYDDDVPHSDWLALMRDRLKILNTLLKPTGFICVHIDDSEGPYLKVLMDEIFGRSNYLATFYVKVRYPQKTLKQDMDFHKEIEQIHIYRKEFGAQPNLNQVKVTFEKFNWYIKELSIGTPIKLGGKKVTVFHKGDYEIIEGVGSEKGLKEIWASGTILEGNSSGRFFRDYIAGREKLDGCGSLYKVEGIGDDQFGFRYFTGPKREDATKGKYYQGVPVGLLGNTKQAKFSPIENFYDLAASFGNCRTEGGVEFRGGKKPETLLAIILKHFSNQGDWVLDSFLGSGTTAAVAHKMGRKWIGVELAEHCHTHCIPRLKAGIDGEQGGISEAVNWKGGGGFKYYYLAPSLLKQDKYGHWVIDEHYNADMLAAAMAKHEGFRYSPDETVYWKQGQSTEKDYIYTTTQFLTGEMLDKMHEELADGESLLICCKSFQQSCVGRFDNITVKKIPNTILGRCEFGKDNYNLNIINPPVIEDDGDIEDIEPQPKAKAATKKNSKIEAGLFDGEDA